MFAEIITIGDEILIGQTVDTNSAWMAKELNKIGVSLLQIRSIHDEKNSIIDALNTVDPRSKLILMTGGLGPTKDDITKKVLADYFGTRLKRDPIILKKIEDWFMERGREVLESNRQQADLPEDATILPNELGTASGMWFEKDGQVFVSMPGVPYEMKGLMSDHVLPKVKESFELPAIYYRTVMTEGRGESYIAEQISEWEATLDAKDVSIAYLPSPGMVKIRLGSMGNDLEELKARVDQEVENLYQLIPEIIYGENDISQEAAIALQLRQRKLRIGTAESCTGGYLAHLFTSVPGSSEYFMGSVISYDNQVKIDQLKVDPSILESKGAVSQEVVEQMAKGLRTQLKLDVTLATSGVAGPDGGSEEKPVGTVWIALASAEEVYSKKFTFEKDRDRNIKRASLAALGMLRRYLNGKLF